MRSLAASLGDHPMAMLRGIAEMHGLLLASNQREEAAAQLAAALAEPEALAVALNDCTPEALAAWRELAAAGGHQKMPAFVRRFGAIRPTGPGKLERETPWQHPVSAAEELWYRGLAYRAFADLGDGPNEYVYVPDQLRQLAAPAAPKLFPDFPVPLPDERRPAQSQRSGNSFAVDMCALVAGVRQTPVRIESAADAAGGSFWRGADEARIREGLILTDPIRLSLLETLAEELGWLAVDRRRLVLRTEPVAAWLRGRWWDQASLLFRAWSGSARWNDLRRLPSLRAEGAWRNHPLPARQAVTAAVGRAHPDEWYAIADLVAWIKGAEPDFQRPDGDYAGWYLRDATSDRFLSGFEHWDDVEGRLIDFLVTGPLFWLGAVELGVTTDDHASPGATAFKLSPAGSAWMAGAVAPPPARPAYLLVDVDFTVRAPLQAPLIDRFRLLRFTDPQQAPAPAPEETNAEAGSDLSPAAAGKAAGDLGQPTRHRITRKSLGRARAAGLDGERLLRFLLRASGGRVPRRVVAGIERWQQHGGTVCIHRGAVLRVEDAATLAALRAEPAIAPLLGELLSAQAVLVSSEALPQLLALLGELGYTARMD